MISDRGVLTLLRAVLLVQTLGLASSLLWGQFESESDIYGLLMFDLDWDEAAAQMREDAGMWAAVFAAVVLAAAAGWERFTSRPLSRVAKCGYGIQLALLAWLTSWQLLYAFAKTYRGGYFMPLWTPGEQAARFMLPVIIALLVWRQWRNSPGETILTASAAEFLLRLAAAVTFFAHGLKAWFGNPEYVNFILASSDNLLGWTPNETGATRMLMFIGVLDIIVAGWLLLQRSTAIAWYMFAWGLITAASRMTSYGWEFYPETIMRAANWGLPLALALWWGGRSGMDGKK